MCQSFSTLWEMGVGGGCVGGFGEWALECGGWWVMMIIDDGGGEGEGEGEGYIYMVGGDGWLGG